MKFKANYAYIYLRECVNNRIQDMFRLPIVVLFDSELPTRVIVRMRHNKNLKLFVVPLVSFVSHLPALFPGPAILIQELDLIIQVLGCDVHYCSRDGIAGGGLAVDGLPGPIEPRPGSPEVGGEKGFRDSEAEHDENEKEKRDGEADGEEVGEYEVLESCAFTGFTGLFGVVLAGGGGEQGVDPRTSAAAGGECHHRMEVVAVGRDLAASVKSILMTSCLWYLMIRAEWE